MKTQCIEYEVVFVDDGSSDGSWDILRELEVQYAGVVTSIQLMRNFGQHNALMCGFRHAQGALIVSMDDDLQNPPTEIPKLLAALQQGNHDLAYGVPEHKQHSRGRNLGSRIINTFYRHVFRTGVTATPFRVMRRELMQSILAYDLNFTFIDGLLAWNTKRIGEVRVKHFARTSGRTGYSFAKLLTLALNLFTNFSLLPLQIASLAGLTASVVGLLAAAYYLVQSLRNNIAVPGYASTIVAIMTLGGLQLMALGIIGEYIGRMHLNLNRKPQYTIRAVKRSDKSHLPVLEQVDAVEG
jgi:polyisoprenyl-phosphate glycosyltransferase